jgi:hypothetical protein
MKSCLECGIVRPLSDYYAHSRMADGHLNKCKSCVKARVLVHRAANLERVQAYDRVRGDLPHRVALRTAYAATSHGRERHAAGVRAANERNPDKRSARVAVGNALRDGRLIRQPCETCAGAKTQAHHDDYAKPLDVRWFCTTCHGAHHRLLRENARMAMTPHDPETGEIDDSFPGDRP